MKYYTGIGSRKTPKDILAIMTALAATLETEGYTLRSGGAGGADSAFEEGCTTKDIYLPWKGFNNSTSPLYIIPSEAFTLAEKLHPAWHNCSSGAMKLHARNTQQVLGTNLDTPSKFLVCWTPGAEPVGGTATAIRLAKDNDIEVINLANPKHLQRVVDFINKP